MTDNTYQKHIKYTYHILSSMIQNPNENLEECGLMTPAVVKEHFLDDQFSVSAVKEGIKLVAQDGLLDVYYRTRCSHCGAFAYMVEDNFAEHQTIQEHQNGEAWTHCANCGEEVFGFEVNNFEVAVPQQYLSEIGETSDPSVGIFQRIRRWLREVFT